MNPERHILAGLALALSVMVPVSFAGDVQVDLSDREAYQVQQPVPVRGGMGLESANEHETRTPGALRHRDRAVTTSDHELIAPEAPGVEMHRPQMSAPAATDRAYQLDRESGEIRFGDGRHGRSPSAASGDHPTYRTGDSKAEHIQPPSPPSGPVPIPYPNIEVQPSTPGQADSEKQSQGSAE